MKSVEQIRNIVVLGHSGSGKTSLVETLLYKAGATTRLGRVDQGTSIADADEEEKNRKITIKSSPLHCEWKGTSLFITDTPGYADFYGEVLAAARVADAGILVIDAVSGIEVGAQKAWATLDALNKPRIIVINKLDKEHSSFQQTLQSIVSTFGNKCVPLQLPVGKEAEFSAVADITTGDGVDNLEPETAQSVNGHREKIVDAAAETDDALLEKYLDAGELAPGEISSGLKTAVARASIVPVFCTSAEKEVGIAELLDALVNYIPSPREIGEVRAGDKTVKPDAGEPFSGYVFKTVTDPYVGQLNYVRVYSGRLAADSEAYNPRKQEKERIGNLYIIMGKDQQTLGEAGPGSVVALAKLKHTSIGDTLCTAGQKLIFDPVSFPKPVTSFAVYSKARGDEDKISEAFHKFTEEDPTLTARRDPMTKEYVLSGLGDVQIQVAMARLKNNFHVEVELREPKVAYKETIRARGEIKYRHKKQTGGAGQFAEVWMHVQPYTEGAENAGGKGKRELIELPWGGKLLFVDEVVGGHIPAQLVQSVKKGYLAAMEKGALAGFPVVNVTATVYDGKTHPVDSKDIAFQIAGRQGFKEASQDAKPVLLEPVYTLEVSVPSEYMGAVTGDLNGRRGQILGMEPAGDIQKIMAQVPLAEVLKYSQELRSMTGGRGNFGMEFSHYQEAPSNISQKVVAQAKPEEDKDG